MNSSARLCSCIGHLSLNRMYASISLHILHSSVQFPLSHCCVNTQTLCVFLTCGKATHRKLEAISLSFKSFHKHMQIIIRFFHYFIKIVFLFGNFTDHLTTFAEWKIRYNCLVIRNKDLPRPSALCKTSHKLDVKFDTSCSLIAFKHHKLT